MKFDEFVINEFFKSPPCSLLLPDYVKSTTVKDHPNKKNQYGELLFDHDHLTELEIKITTTKKTQQRRNMSRLKEVQDTVNVHGSAIQQLLKIMPNKKHLSLVDRQPPLTANCK